VAGEHLLLEPHRDAAAPAPVELAGLAGERRQRRRLGAAAALQIGVEAGGQRLGALYL
jgi:hypothetical protein